MPNYTYKADVPGSCVTCADGIVRFERMGDERLKKCPECAQTVHVAITPSNAPTVGAMDPRLSSEPLYMSQLARFPGDPEAYVSGPHSWARKVDEAKRAGARIGEVDDVSTKRDARRKAQGK